MLLAAFALAAAAQPVITGINKTNLPRSGRVAIVGSGFGLSGDVVIGGRSAWTSTWTDTRIVAYVPEAAGLGTAALHVAAQGQQSNTVSLTVSARQSSGRIRWSFEADGDNLRWRPALAPDGTIYLHTNNTTDGLVYALSPNGALRWIQKVNWNPYVPPSAGPDGAVYVGSIGTIYRISPAGGIDWQYNPPNGINIEVSPTIGPDGLLYGAFEVSGAFAIEPLTGEVVWSNPGDPMMTDKSGEATEMKFGPAGPNQPVDQLYLSMDGGAGFYGFSLDGEQLFTAGLDNITGTAEAAIGSDGKIYGPRFIGLWVAAIDPSDGSTLWQYDPGWATGTRNVEIGPDDTLYFTGSSAYLEAFNPHAERSLWRNNAVLGLGRPSVTPDGSTLVVSGANNGQPGFVKAYATRNGRELWSLDLPFQASPSLRVLGTHHPRITPDSATAYVSTVTLAEWPLNQDPHSSLYAINIDGSPDAPVDSDGDGAVDEVDNCTFVPNGQQTDTDADGYGNACDADFNNDLMVNGLDVGPFISQFGTAGPDADFNGDGLVNGLDIGPFVDMYGQPPGPSGQAP